MASSDASYSEEAKLHASLLLQMGEWYKGTDWLPNRNIVSGLQLKEELVGNYKAYC